MKYLLLACLVLGACGDPPTAPSSVPQATGTPRDVMQCYNIAAPRGTYKLLCPGDAGYEPNH